LTKSMYNNGPVESNGLPEPLITPHQSAGDTEASEQAIVARLPTTLPLLLLGSDVEIARLVASQLKRRFGSVPYCEGQFWAYTDTYWEPIPRDELRRLVHKCDGLEWGYEHRRVRLSKNRIDSIINELGVILGEPDYFETHSVGINCLSGFISFDDRSPRLLPHAPEHRQRHVIPGHWEPARRAEIPDGSLLGRLLRGSFEGDDDADAKIDLLGEIAGAAALGHGPKLTAPKAAVLLGRTAENGKSQVLDLLRGLLPPSAVSSVPPTKFGDDRHSVKLVGKLLNTSDELGTAKAIASEGFKAVITGEPVTAREVYSSAVEFRPQAQHVFACNQLPAFQGGMDRGCTATAAGNRVQSEHSTGRAYFEYRATDSGQGIGFGAGLGSGGGRSLIGAWSFPGTRQFTASPPRVGPGCRSGARVD